MAHLIIVDVVPPTLTFTDSNTTNGTGSHTINGLNFGPAASDRVMATTVFTNDNLDPITSVTIGGASATRVVKVPSNSGAQSSVEIWCAAVPTGTSGTIVLHGGSGSVSWTSLLGIYAMTGLISSTPTDTDTAAGTGITTISTNVTMQPLGVSISVAGGNLKSSSITWTGPSQDYFLDPSNTSGGASFIATGGGSLTSTAKFNGDFINLTMLGTAAFR